MTRKRIGVAVGGFGWMGQAHTRSCLRVPTLFPDRSYDPDMVVISDNVRERVDEAVGEASGQSGGELLAAAHACVHTRLGDSRGLRDRRQRHIGADAADHVLGRVQHAVAVGDGEPSGGASRWATRRCHVVATPHT